MYLICVTYGLLYFSFRFVSLRFFSFLFFFFNFVSFLTIFFSFFCVSFFSFLFVAFLLVFFSFFFFPFLFVFFRFSVYRYPNYYESPLSSKWCFTKVLKTSFLLHSMMLRGSSYQFLIPLKRRHQINMFYTCYNKVEVGTYPSSGRQITLLAAAW